MSAVTCTMMTFNFASIELIICASALHVGGEEQRPEQHCPEKIKTLRKRLLMRFSDGEVVIRIMLLPDTVPELAQAS